MQTMQKHVREVQVQSPGPYFLFSPLSPLPVPLKANLQGAPLEVICQLAVAANLAVSVGESFPTLPVEVLKLLILFYCNSAGQFSLNMLKTERALQLPSDQNCFINLFLPPLIPVEPCMYCPLLPWDASQYVLGIFKIIILYLFLYVKTSI